MLRDKSLIPLSRQHQHALALCVRIERASPIPDADLEAWHAEIVQLFQMEIGLHFTAEEEVLFPVACQLGELKDLVSELRSDHNWLREQFGGIDTLSSDRVVALGQRLSEHIRKEERQLFERMQQLLSQPQLESLGQRLNAALKEAPPTCLLPTEATRLRSRE